jgi:hypothetical protein
MWYLQGFETQKVYQLGVGARGNLGLDLGCAAHLHLVLQKEAFDRIW